MTPVPRTPPQLSDAQKTFIAAGARSGTIDVKVDSLVGYKVVCGSGDPGQLNEMALSRGRKNVAVSVTTRTSGSWGLSVGWTKTIDPKSSE